MSQNGRAVSSQIVEDRLRKQEGDGHAGVRSRREWSPGAAAGAAARGSWPPGDGHGDEHGQARLRGATGRGRRRDGRTGPDVRRPSGGGRPPGRDRAPDDRDQHCSRRQARPEALRPVVPAHHQAAHRGNRSSAGRRRGDRRAALRRAGLRQLERNPRGRLGEDRGGPAGPAREDTRAPGDGSAAPRRGCRHQCRRRGDAIRRVLRARRHRRPGRTRAQAAVPVGRQRHRLCLLVARASSYAAGDRSRYSTAAACGSSPSGPPVTSASVWSAWPASSLLAGESQTFLACPTAPRRPRSFSVSPARTATRGLRRPGRRARRWPCWCAARCCSRWRWRAGCRRARRRWRCRSGGWC